MVCATSRKKNYGIFGSFCRIYCRSGTASNQNGTWCFREIFFLLLMSWHIVHRSPTPTNPKQRSRIRKTKKKPKTIKWIAFFCRNAIIFYRRAQKWLFMISSFCSSRSNYLCAAITTPESGVLTRSLRNKNSFINARKTLNKKKAILTFCLLKLWLLRSNKQCNQPDWCKYMVNACHKRHRLLLCMYVYVDLAWVILARMVRWLMSEPTCAHRKRFFFSFFNEKPKFPDPVEICTFFTFLSFQSWFSCSHKFFSFFLKQSFPFYFTLVSFSTPKKNVVILLRLLKLIDPNATFHCVTLKEKPSKKTLFLITQKSL